jgi:hypothetical protein
MRKMVVGSDHTLFVQSGGGGIRLRPVASSDSADRYRAAGWGGKVDGIGPGVSAARLQVALCGTKV